VTGLPEDAVRNAKPAYGIGVWLVSFFAPLAVAGLLHEIGVGSAW